MTDTTDIKALREQCTDERMCGACFSGQGICSNQRGQDYLRGKLIGIDNEKDLHQFATHLIDQIEAERQRADDNSAECQRQASKVGRIKHELNKAESEIAALKAKLEIIHVLLDVKNELEKTFLKK